MPSEVVAVLGTLSGALLVGLINYFSNRSVKNHEWRLALAREEVAGRQKLYAEFLVEAQRLVVQAREDKISSATDLNALNGKYAEVCLVAPQSVIEEAKKLAEYAITSHAAQPAKEAADFFSIKERFIAVAREDMAKVLREA
jgi:ribosomal protein L1